MRTLSYNADANGFIQPTASLITRKGKEFWLGNPMSEIEEAMDEGAAFKAHTLKGMRPVELIVNPADVSTIQAVKA